MVPPPIPLSGAVLDPSSHTLVMGIINTTPDSFSDGGLHFHCEAAVTAALQMLDQGADILDVGGESTRPGSSPVSVEEERARTIDVIRNIRSARPDAVISIDTRRRRVAEPAIEAGARIINDVAGFRHDPSMIDLARETSVGVVVMHMLGEPKTMQETIQYRSFPQDIHDFFVERIHTLEDRGIAPERIIIDPGIGFGKTFDQNLMLINRLAFFQDLGKHILVGASRKAFLGKILDEPVPAKRDQGTMATVTAAVLRGASIVRVHNVQAAVQTCKVADAILREQVHT